jgi:penicillin-binding protein 1B
VSRRRRRKTRRARSQHRLLKLLAACGVLLALALVYLDARISSTFSERMWELPAKVYARPLELYPGAALAAENLLWELETLGYRAVQRVRQPGQYQRSGASLTVYTRGFDFADGREPARRIRLRIDGGRVSELAADEAALPLMRLDPLQIGGIYPRHGEDRLLVRLPDVPRTLIRGLLAVEDRRFYQHWGFSLSGMGRALLSNVRSGRVVAGGSTITQQLVKNYYLTPERTVWRKLTELAMALLLELRYPKDAILESYLNEVYLGQEGARAIHGFALAAEHYFQTPLWQTGLHQQALLVGMIKGPSLYNPLRHPERALERRNVVLDAMQAEGVINAEQALLAKAMPLDVNRRPRLADAFPAFLDLVRRQLRQEYREQDLASLGLRIFTTFDPLLQRELERSTESAMQRVDPDGTLETASVVSRVDSGEVAALVGGREARYAGFNRALDARRPAGSLLKPAIYLAALSRSERYTLATPLADTPLVVDLPDGTQWQPRNFDRDFRGELPLFLALAESRNVASVRLGLELGLPEVVRTLRALGLQTALPEVPALMLGAGEYAPIDLLGMYQTIASGGFRMPLRSIRDIVDAEGRPLRRYPLNYERTLDTRAVHLLHYALRASVHEGTARGLARYLSDDFAVAAKTGTSDAGRDTWFAGFSGDLLAVSWIGSDDNRSTTLTGSNAALHVWGEFMAQAATRPLAYRMPDGVAVHWVQLANGARSAPGCEGARLLPFIEGSEPRRLLDCEGRRRNTVRDWFQKLFGGSP